MKQLAPLACALACTGTLAACGGSSGIANRRPASEPSHAMPADVAAYRHTLEVVNSLLSSDSSTFDECAIAYNAPACIQWAKHDQQLVRQSITKLDSARAPARWLKDNARLIRLLRRFRRDDTSLVRDSRASKSSPTVPSQAVINASSDLDTQTTSSWLPLLHRLDPSISIPQE
jgi:hypothetical protein